MSDELPERRASPPRSLGRRRADRKWPRLLRDGWLVVITGLVALALASSHDRQKDICSNGNQVRQQLNERSALTPIKVGRRIVVLPAVNAELLKLSAALTHTRQEEATVFGVFLAVTRTSIREQARTQEQQQLAAKYVTALNRLIGDYSLAAQLDSQVRDALLSIRYRPFPRLRC